MRDTNQQLVGSLGDFSGFHSKSNLFYGIMYLTMDGSLFVDYSKPPESGYSKS